MKNQVNQSLLDYIKKWANSLQWCYKCMEATKTKDWDCVKCGFSKPLPTKVERVLNEKQEKPSVH